MSRTSRGGPIGQRSDDRRQGNRGDIPAAAEVELSDARGYGYNDFKIELAKRTIVSVVKRNGGSRRCAMSVMQSIMETVAHIRARQEERSAH